RPKLVVWHPLPHMAPFHEILAEQAEKLKEILSQGHAAELDALQKQNAMLTERLATNHHQCQQLRAKLEELQPSKDGGLGHDYGELTLELLQSGDVAVEIATTNNQDTVKFIEHLQAELDPPRGEIPGEPVHPHQRWAVLVDQALVHSDALEEARVRDEHFTMSGTWRTSFKNAQGKGRTNNTWEVMEHRQGARSSRISQLGAQITDDYYRRWQKLIISPKSNARLGWLLLGSLFILLDMVIIPLSIFDIGSHMFFKVQMVVSFVFWLCDMGVSFFSGFHERGRMEMRPAVIARNYMKTMFPLDIFLLSMDVVMFVLDATLGADADALRTTRILRSLRLLRLLRLLRVGKLRAILKAFEKRLTNAYSVLILKLSSALATVLLINHFIACGWFYVGLEGDEERNWLLLSRMDDRPFPEVYITSMHWSLTQFMPATNNVGPDNIWERLFAILTVFVAVCLFSSLVSSITAAVGAFRAAHAEQIKQEAAVIAFFEERKLSAELFEAVRTHGAKKGSPDATIRMSDVKILRECPESLKIRLSEEVFMPAFKNSAWISGDQVERSFLMKVCHSCMDEQVQAPGKDIFLPGQDAAQAYFSSRGDLHYVELQGSRRSGIPVLVEPGSWLCEPVLWAQWHHRGQLTTTGTCCLMCLKSAKFADCAAEMGGGTYQFLFMFGILYIGQIERVSQEGGLVSDRGLDARKMMDLADRAHKFLTVSARQSRPLTPLEG
ncbi:unnamed protein product, partial [Effrenium voratum]